MWPASADSRKNSKIYAALQKLRMQTRWMVEKIMKGKINKIKTLTAKGFVFFFPLLHYSISLLKGKSVRFTTA